MRQILTGMSELDMDKNYKSIIESLLFVWGEPLTVEKMASVLEIPVRVVRQYLTELSAEYEFRASGVQIMQLDNAYQMCSLRDNYQYIERMLNTSKSKGLSQSALEVLAVVAYRQPVTKTDIENVRGVKSDKPVSVLLERTLIEERGRSDRPGKPVIYGTSNEFLRVFGLSSIKDLPQLEELVKLNDYMNSQSAEEELENSAKAIVND